MGHVQHWHRTRGVIGRAGRAGEPQPLTSSKTAIHHSVNESGNAKRNERSETRVLVGLELSQTITQRLVPWSHSHWRRFLGALSVRTNSRRCRAIHPLGSRSLENSSPPLANRSLSDIIPPVGLQVRASRLVEEIRVTPIPVSSPLEALSVPHEHWSQVFDIGIVVAHTLRGLASFRLLNLLPTMDTVDIVSAHTQSLGSRVRTLS
jgi:hypothetical protein